MVTTYSVLGNDIDVNNQTAGDQYMPRMTALNNGTFVVTWFTTDAAQDGSSYAIKARHYDASGNALGSEILVNAAATGLQRSPVVAALNNGGFAIAWETQDTAQDGNGFAIKARAFNSDMTAASGEILVNSETLGNQTAPNITALENGGFAVSWTTSQPALAGHGTEVKGRIFSDAGVAAGPEFFLNTTTLGSQNGQQMSGLANGGFVSTWTIGQGSTADIMAQLFDANGAKVGGEFAISSSATGEQSRTAVAALPGGGFVASWFSAGTPSGIVYRIFDASGVPTGAETSVGLASGSIPRIAVLSDGNFAIVSSGNSGTAGSTNVSARVFDASGAPVTAAFLAVNDTTAFEMDAEVTALPGGGFAIGWTHMVVGTSVTLDIKTRIFDSNTSPELGAPTLAINAQENQTYVADFNATDIDGDSVAYSIIGGADAAKFTINATTGVLSFVSAQDFETPTDSGGDNDYDVIVRASDGTLFDTQAIAISVLDSNEPIAISSNGGGETASLVTAENGTLLTTVTASDPENASLSYAITGGADASLFTINAATGALSFIAAPNYEAPADAGADNVYDVIVSASDGVNTDNQSLAVTVTNTNEGLSFTTGAAFGVLENSSVIATVSATDLDGDTVTYAIAGGADAALFAVDAATGALSFVAAPNFEAPGDAGADNVYNVVVSASDGSFTATSAIAVTVSNANEGVSITSGAAFGISENSTSVGTVTASDIDGDAVSFSITGGADAALFLINAATGALSFASAPNFEAPGDAGTNNVYEVLVSASDGSLLDTQSLFITVSDVNETVTITSGGGGASASVSIGENGTAVTTVVASDPENAALAYAIAGGADAALFTIDAATGALSFIATPNFEAPGDAGGDNVYDVVVEVSDGVFIDTQALAVTISNENEAPSITSNGGGASATISIAENSSAVTTVTSTDPDGNPRTYTIASGADAARFAIDAATGALSFVAAPDFDAPNDADANNVYDIVVQATDGSLVDTQALAVTVTNVNEAPVITSNGGGAAASITVNENTTAVTTVTSTDPEGTARTYAISGGVDAARFTINTTTGVLSFVAAPNFEAPTDVGANNIYDVIVRASDGTNIDTQILAVTVANVIDGSTINGTSGGNTLTGTVAEDTINGLGGNDTITGSGGADTLTGGTGADRFVYSLTTNSVVGARDIITDFSRTQGDKISVNPIDANTNVANNQNFTFIGNAAFSNVAGQLRFEQVSGNTFVSGDVNGDGLGDFSIQVNGLVNFVASDFIL